MKFSLDDLYKTKRISRWEYRTYLVFAGDDVGQEYLKETIDMMFMEEPQVMSAESITFSDGRRSVWRDIKRIIESVKKKMETEDDRPDGIYNYGSSNGLD